MNKEIRPLTPFEKKQKEFLLKEYPMLDDLMIDTAIRLTDSQRTKIVEQIKNGELKEESKTEYTLPNVSVLKS